MIDISARVEAQEKLRLTSKALEHIVEGILILDEQLRILSSNRAYSEMTGRMQTELLGQVPYGMQDGIMEPALRREILSAVGSSGHWRGELHDRKADGSTYPQLMSLSAVRDESGRLTQYVAVATDMTQLHSYEDRMAFLASHDALSGLPNRFMLMRRLTQAVTHARNTGHLAAMLYVDLDNFKLVNNSFGTSVGDEALRLLAHRLQESVAGTGEAFHLGSDGFAVLLSKLDSPRQARDLAEDILVRLEEPLESHGQSLYLSASIGIAISSADCDAQTLYRQAKTALLVAQRRGPSSIEQFTGGEADSSQSLLLVNGLRRALEHGELFLHYQPYFDLNSGEVSGVEALLRWQHPELGLVPPARVIPLAEETGHIMRLGDWVLRTACTQMRTWQDAGLNDMHVAVNVSARQLRRPDFLERLTQTLDETGLLPGSLVLELTESSMMENPERAREVFQQLHELGVGIAIDDFGTGYSSLNYLRHYQVDYLKVDRAFVSNLPHDEHQQAIIRAIIAMAKSLDIQVIAEGVETAAQWEFLKTLECEQGQGFLFARPETALRVEALLRAGPIHLMKLQ
jgi:diguanylate cyclase (GGDEF)-like protein/PAS domain S-box-containing protein